MVWIGNGSGRRRWKKEVGEGEEVKCGSKIVLEMFNSKWKEKNLYSATRRGTIKLLDKQ